MAKTKPSKKANASSNRIRNKVRAILTDLLSENGGCMRISALPVALIREEFEPEDRDFAELEMNLFLATLDQPNNPFHQRIEDGRIFICLDP